MAFRLSCFARVKCVGVGGSLQLEEASLDRGFEGIVLPRQVRRVHRGHAVFAGTEAQASAATRASDETAAARGRG